MNDPKKNADVDQARRAVFLEVDERENDELLQDQVSGYDFNKGIDYDEIFKTFRTTGFQAANLSKAIDIINEMLKQRQEPFESDNLETDLFIQRRSGCTIFLGYTSNIVSSGMRDMIRFLVQHKMVDCLVTTGGGIEEDLIKCLAPFYTGDFNLEGDKLREKALNRIGNLLVPNENYCKFEDWVIPILDEMLKEQLEQKIIWKPSTIIERLGKKINNEQSICYWAALNKIPIFCPALTDGSLGDMVFFHRKTRDPGLIIDIAGDIERINSIPLKARKSASVIIGAGIPKHHIFNANLMRGGSDYAVLLNTANEFDGSDAGARPDEAVSWGKIRPDAKSVKVHCDASIALPIIVAQTFAQHFHSTRSGLTKNP